MAKEPLQQKPGQQDVPLTTGSSWPPASADDSAASTNALLPNGKTVAQQTLERIQAATNNVIVVTRDELLDNLLRGGAPAERTVLAPMPIFQAIRSLAALHTFFAHWDAVLVCLPTCPLSKPAPTPPCALRPGDAIVVPEHQGKRGNPWGLAESGLRNWLRPAGTVVAGVMKGNPNAIVKVAVEDPKPCIWTWMPGILGCTAIDHR
ncbi:MAG: NTP transferase domain-containing protein [Gammaproteobacteria bacterium]